MRKWIHSCNDGFDKLSERIVWTFERMDLDMYGTRQCDTRENKGSVENINPLWIIIFKCRHTLFRDSAMTSNQMPIPGQSMFDADHRSEWKLSHWGRRADRHKKIRWSSPSNPRTPVGLETELANELILTNNKIEIESLTQCFWINPSLRSPRVMACSEKTNPNSLNSISWISLISQSCQLGSFNSQRNFKNCR